VYESYFHRILEKTEDIIDHNVINTHLTGKPEGAVVSRGNCRLSLTMRSVAQVNARDLTLPESPEEKEEKRRREAFFYRSISEKN